MDRSFSHASGTGLSRRAFIRFCAVTASLLALPPGAAPILAAALVRARRLPVVWLSFQECTGCTESLSRSAAPTLERLLFDLVSLDYHHTLQAASGTAAEQAREAALKAHAGQLLLVVDGSVPTALGGACSTIAGEDNLSLLRRCLAAAEAVLAVGTCASFGGLPAAAPNPTGAMGVAELMERGLVPRRPLVNLPGCPPVPEVIAAVLAHRVAFGGFPAQDAKGQSGHPCLGCSEPGFWDRGGFYRPIDKLLLSPAEPATAPAERGAAVYDSQCVYCHDADPASLKTPADQTAEFLRSGKVRAHRFILDDADMQALVDYLKESR